MKAIEALREFFSRERDVAAVFVYGTYAGEISWPDTDIEIALLFSDRLDEDGIGEYMERLSDQNPLAGHPGVLMPFALNTHILPVVHEILQGGTLLVDNDEATRRAFVRAAEERLEGERPRLLDEAREAILQTRNLGTVVGATDDLMLPQPPRYLDPIRVGWRLGRILGSLAVLDEATRELERTVRDAERVGQMIGWYSNAVGAATGIAKAMLNMFGMPRPMRRWEIFLPLADARLMTMELALELGAAVELRWSLISGGMLSWERVSGGVRRTLGPVIAFARLASWYAEVPGGRGEQRVH